jgi:hypothetical protein
LGARRRRTGTNRRHGEGRRCAREEQDSTRPERDALFLEAKRIAVAYMPWKFRIHRIDHELIHPWVSGYRKPLFWAEWWHLIDIDDSKRPRP